MKRNGLTGLSVFRKRLILYFMAMMIVAFSFLGLGVKSKAAVSATGDFADALLAIVPEYQGLAFVPVNNNVPFFTAKDVTVKPFEIYSNLDAYGRCGVAYANLCKELMPTEARTDISMIKPIGWQNTKYPGYVEGEMLFNRCHLIAHSLAGENANTKNLITGTRYLNANGMLGFENLVLNYINTHPANHVLYRVTPIYAGKNLLASGVLMEAYSVEDGGAGIKFCVYCYNVQPGFIINYSNGDSKLVDPAKCVISSPYTNASQTASQSQATQAAKITTSTPATTGVYYIGNARNGKLHKSTCTNLPVAKNQRKYATKQEAIAAGYNDPCSGCRP